MTPEKYKATRIALGYTRAQLAEMLGVHVVTIAKRETGAAGAPITREAELAIASLAKTRRQHA